MSLYHCRHQVRKVATFVCANALLCACGGGEGDDSAGDRGNGADASMAIPSEFGAYCTAQFMENYDVTDVFGDFNFTARAGEKYLMTSYESNSVTLIYLADDGPSEFEVQSLAGGLPFESNCGLGNTSKYLAAFTSVQIFADEALGTPLCTLNPNSVVPYDQTAPWGYSSTDFSFSGPTVYEVYLNTFATECGGSELGYIRVPSTKLFGTTTWLVPIIPVLGPP